jgi:hypothetical protein
VFPVKTILLFHRDIVPDELNIELGATMLIKTEVAKFAEHWVAAWNSHNLEEIMSHYEEDVELISPVAAQLLQDPSGRVVGKDALRNYFRKGLETYPNLKFTPKGILHS